MKASELIDKLKALVEIHGDYEVKLPYVHETDEIMGYQPDIINIEFFKPFSTLFEPCFQIEM